MPRRGSDPDGGVIQVGVHEEVAVREHLRARRVQVAVDQVGLQVDVGVVAQRLGSVGPGGDLPHSSPATALPPPLWGRDRPSARRGVGHPRVVLTGLLVTRPSRIWASEKKCPQTSRVRAGPPSGAPPSHLKPI